MSDFTTSEAIATIRKDNPKLIYIFGGPESHVFFPKVINALGITYTYINIGTDTAYPGFEGSNHISWDKFYRWYIDGKAVKYDIEEGVRFAIRSLFEKEVRV